MDASSFARLSGSRNLGEGSNIGGLPSESERPLDGDLETSPESLLPFPDPLAVPSFPAKVMASFSFDRSILRLALER